jgi:erythromycin esterase-like protein
MNARLSDIAEWVRGAGARLSWPMDGAGGDIAPLSMLDRDLAGADLVFLGEMNHFVHEKSDFRLLLCRYLLSRGWTHFAEELGWSDGARLQRYFERGDEGEFDRLSLFGYRGDLRADRDDRPTGLFKASFDVYPVDLVRAEQSRFYRGLAGAAAGAPIRYRGFDIDAAPGGGYADIAALLAPYGGDAVHAFLAALARVGGETAAQEASRLAALTPRAAALAPVTGAAVAAEIAAALAALSDSLAYIDRTYAAKTYDALRPGMAFREGCMKRRFEALRALEGGAPTVVMGHAHHLAKNDNLARPGAGVGPGGGLEPSIGHHLARTLWLKTVAIWMIYGDGEDSQPFPDLARKASYPKNTLNAALRGIETPVLFRLADAPDGLFDPPIGVGHMYNAVQTGVLAGQVDAILYLPSVSPMRF